MTRQVCAVVQPITGDSADAIAKKCPGLFTVEGSGKNRRANVKPAREHTQLLEKVLTLVKLIPNLSAFMLYCTAPGVKCMH